MCAGDKEQWGGFGFGDEFPVLPFGEEFGGRVHHIRQRVKAHSEKQKKKKKKKKKEKKEEKGGMGLQLLFGGVCMCMCVYIYMYKVYTYMYIVCVQNTDAMNKSTMAYKDHSSEVYVVPMTQIIRICECRRGLTARV